MGSFPLAERVGTTIDAGLVLRARAGDATAFETLVRPRLDRCFRLAWSILSNDADAADAMQDALVAAWRQLPRLRDPAAFDGWLNRVVANAALMQRRRRIRRREVQVLPVGDQDSDVTATAAPGSSQSAEDGPARIADRDVIVRAFMRVRPEERAILVLHHLEERPVAEIARMLGVPTGTAKWRLHEARRALERAMEVEA
ncbi:MAG TPA: sigma-70 family RNA polymerase sigma factor [Candidatus Limnocylindrales bacterium]